MCDGKNQPKDTDWESQLHTKTAKQWGNQEQPDVSMFPMFVIFTLHKYLNTKSKKKKKEKKSDLLKI